MNVRIESTWQKHLAEEFDQSYFSALTDFVRAEYSSCTVYPPAGKIFSAFDSCPFDDVKVVIIGQDPYHEVGQAHGLYFSVNDGVPFPPSLRNIFVEIQREIGAPIPPSGNLERWAHQGVLLLNATLTVRAGQAGSHQRHGWETFTDNVIKKISDEKSGVVFLLWGAYAKSKMGMINQNKHLVLTANHPSPLSANRGGWFGCGHFTATNEYLVVKGKKPIEW
ncbi:MAG: uracil-DNA glycosylase [Flavobacteriales bacterium]|nr:uracil-DNA glycosylase [Flavobacteriales bacterium]